MNDNGSTEPKTCSIWENLSHYNLPKYKAMLICISITRLEDNKTLTFASEFDQLDEFLLKIVVPLAMDKPNNFREVFNFSVAIEQTNACVILEIAPNYIRCDKQNRFLESPSGIIKCLEELFKNGKA